MAVALFQACPARHAGGSCEASVRQWPRLQHPRVSSLASVSVQLLGSLKVAADGLREAEWCSGSTRSLRKRLGIRAVAEIAEAATACLRDVDENDEMGNRHSLSFEGVRTEKELMNAIRKEVDSGRLPQRGGDGMVELYCNYRDAVLSSGVENARDIAVQVMSTVLDRILVQFENPFTFAAYHEKMVEPFDYYTFGQNYVRPLVDFRNSYLGNVAILDKIQQQLNEGHNVLFMSNHQTEADPAVIALLLESRHCSMAENLIYVAGDRVVLDPLLQTIQHGQLVEMKQKANSRTLKEMAMLLKRGGQLVWIAPSGGRDRPDPVTQEWIPAAFDPSAVESMRRLSEAVKVPSHIYPTALLCFDIMPPPHQVEKKLGERRAVGYSGTGLAVAPELIFAAVTSGVKKSQEARDLYAQVAWEAVNDNYNVLKAAIFSGKGFAAATLSCSLSQTWTEGAT